MCFFAKTSAPCLLVCRIIVRIDNAIWPIYMDRNTVALTPTGGPDVVVNVVRDEARLVAKQQTGQRTVADKIRSAGSNKSCRSLNDR